MTENGQAVDTMPKYSHGTNAAYNLGCRCDWCIGAHKTHMQALRAARKAKMADP